MKTKPSHTAKISNHSFRSLLLIITLGLILMSCSDDDNAPDTRPQFLGDYAVEDISGASGYTYTYDITIENGSGKELNISNFADILNVPVKAVVDGSSLTIKSQSFTNPNSGNTIEVSGSGFIEGDVLTFTYETTGYIEYSGTCTATKK
jgi:hypothetical protein